MIVLITGLIIFLAVHSISIVSHPWRNHMVDRLGEIRWKGGYAFIALLGFALIVWGYGLARQDPSTLYSSSTWLHNIALLMLLPVFPLLLSAYLPGRIQATTRHPMLLATALWAAAHLLVNGSLADVLLFGSFLAWAIADLVSMKYRPPIPAPGAPPSAANDIIAVVLGLGLYVVFVTWLHARLFGVPVIAT